MGHTMVETIGLAASDWDVEEIHVGAVGAWFSIARTSSKTNHFNFQDAQQSQINKCLFLDEYNNVCTEEKDAY